MTAYLDIENEITRISSYVHQIGYPNWPIDVVRFDVSTPIRTGQYIYTAPSHENSGLFMSWAFLDDKKHLKMINSHYSIMPPYKWNDGLNLWIIHYETDSVILPDYFIELINSLISRYGTLNWIHKQSGQYQYYTSDKINSLLENMKAEI